MRRGRSPAPPQTLAGRPGPAAATPKPARQSRAEPASEPKAPRAGGRAAKAAKASPCAPLPVPGHTLRPEEMGRHVVVIGDGWGSGEGGYEAVVTEADNQTF